MIDVGANIGSTAIEGALAVGPSGTVHAIEPHPVIHRCLQENLQLNGLSGRVITHEVAITDVGPPGCHLPFSNDRRDDMNCLLSMDIGSMASDGMATRTINAGERSGGVVGTAIPHPVSSIDLPAPGITVPATTLDQLFPGLPRCDLLKVDVEGAELAVLRGGASLLARTRQVLVEAGDPNSLRHGNSAVDLHRHLESAGFEVCTADFGLAAPQPVCIENYRHHVGNWLARRRSTSVAGQTGSIRKT